MATVAGRGERAPKSSQAKPRATASIPTRARPSEQEIRSLAYILYERRCEAGIDGDPDADWMQAERLLSNGVPAEN